MYARFVGLESREREYSFSVRLSVEDLERFVRVMCMFLGEDSYPKVNVSRSQQFRLLLRRLPKSEVILPFGGESLLDYYLREWSVHR